MKKLYLEDNQRFGKLTVLGRAPNNKFRQSCFLCKCDCGQTTIKLGSTLKRGKVQSCGCLYKGAKPHLRKRPFESMYNIMKYANSLRDVDVTCTYEEFLTFTKIDRCYYCGGNVKWVPFGTKSRTYNLDRIDNSIGYTKDNCVVCCGRCNRMKHTLGQKEFLDLCKQITNTQLNRN